MPARTAEKVYREVLHATGKVDGKVHKWVVAVFANESRLRSHVAILNMAYKGGDVATIAAMDPHSPATGKDAPATDVKFSKNTVVYNPEAPGLDSDTALS